MKSEEFEKIVERFSAGGDEIRRVSISDEELGKLTYDQAQHLVHRFGMNRLVELPEREQRFFNWLKEVDEPIWHDLWSLDEEGDPEYVVSTAHLISFLPNQRGFPICDLVRQDNYYFQSEDITDEDGKTYVERALEVVAEDDRLTMDQAFMIEVWRAPIDMWRFAWLYEVPLQEVKHMVRWLLQEELLGVPAQREENPPPIESLPPDKGIADDDD